MAQRRGDAGVSMANLALGVVPTDEEVHAIKQQLKLLGHSLPTEAISKSRDPLPGPSATEQEPDWTQAAAVRRDRHDQLMCTRDFLSRPHHSALDAGHADRHQDRDSLEHNAAKPRKVDRVTRHRELQQVWNKDAFLRSGGTAKTSKRRGENFNELYAACHAAEDKLKELTLKHGKAAKGSLKGKQQQENVAPTDKRRDALRWETRMRMQLRDGYH
ncbi:hypothetical protein WJX82_007022 [Trebouxia sp. C0006]